MPVRKDNSKIKIMVADDNPLFREELCRLLDSEGDIEAKQFLSRYSREFPTACETLARHLA